MPLYMKLWMKREQLLSARWPRNRCVSQHCCRWIWSGVILNMCKPWARVRRRSEPINEVINDRTWRNRMSDEAGAEVRGELGSKTEEGGGDEEFLSRASFLLVYGLRGKAKIGRSEERRRSWMKSRDGRWPWESVWGCCFQSLSFITASTFLSFLFFFIAIEAAWDVRTSRG